MVVDARGRIVRTAHGHPRFSGLTPDDVEELFDATSEIVVRRHQVYSDADHVGASLWTGMELRARDLFRRRSRRGPDADPTALDQLQEDLEDHDERISQEQELLVVADFLAALAPAEAAVWRLVHGDEVSVAGTARRLGLSRHAVREHLDAATRKLETFVALAHAGEWCGRRRADIVRMLEGSDDRGTARRALAHLDACPVCRRAHAAQVRETGRIAAGVLPVPALLGTAGAGRGMLERLVEWVPHLGGGSGRMEAIGGALVSGGGLATVAKVGTVVATSATVAVGAGSAVVTGGDGHDRGAPVAEHRARAARASAAARAPVPISAPVRSAPATSARSTASRPGTRASTGAPDARPHQRRPRARDRRVRSGEGVDVVRRGGGSAGTGPGRPPSAVCRPPRARAGGVPAVGRHELLDSPTTTRLVKDR
ncbi:hypothetical protein [Paraconexibacter sp.]|uniref:hypothetical protein n=1 Tax=Paraconexibacter sp. TaxID=2949640 RepID=UPI0035664BDD